MAIFKNKFFSKAGQKERLKNAGQVLKAAFDFNKNTRVNANIGNKTLKKVAEAVANNPYTSAAVVAGGITAGKALLGAGAKTAASAASAARAGASSSAKGLLGGGLRKAAPYVIGGAGALLLGRGGRQDVTPSQISNPQQAIDAGGQGGQDFQTNPYVDSGESFAEVRGDNNYIDQRKYLKTSTYSITRAANVPSQVITPQLTNTPAQTATASGQTDWLPLALIAGALILFK